jgi:hypothetical protein
MASVCHPSCNQMRGPQTRNIETNDLDVMALLVVEAFRVGVPAIVVPLGVFAANWAFRHRNGYAQTAAADLILAVLIFDGGAVAASEALEPFVRNADLRSIMVGFHMSIAVIGGFIWWAILTWGEPAVTEYYEASGLGRFPFVSFALCWMGVFFLICAHVLFYFIQGTGVGHA